MSWLNFPLDDRGLPLSTRRGRKVRAEGPLDSTLQRLEAEVPAPTGKVAIVFTDIKNSTQLWEAFPDAMRTAIRLHNEVMRRQLRIIGGFEVKTEGDAFMVAFPTPTSALLWCFAVQTQLLQVNWPEEITKTVTGQPTFDRDNKLIFRGLSVRMGINWGVPYVEPDPVTRRMDYFGPMVNKASRVSSCADGGQITVSSEFLEAIKVLLGLYEDFQRTGVDPFGDDDDAYGPTIRNELSTLARLGVDFKDLGETKLKGLENPEQISALYPYNLASRYDEHSLHERAQSTADKPAVLSPDSELAIDPDDIWSLWRVSLRLERLCSALEDAPGRGLQPPETELLERMKNRGGEVTERFLVNFLEHQVSRIEVCSFHRSNHPDAEEGKQCN
jgi:adenylate cyclase